LLAKAGEQGIHGVKLGQAHHGLLQLLENLGVVQGALSLLPKLVAAAHVPPSIYVLVSKAELSEGDDWIFECLRAKGSTLQLAILNVDMVVQLRIVLIGNHREKKGLLLVNSWITDFEPEFYCIFSGIIGQIWRHKRNHRAVAVKLSCHVSVIAGDAVKNTLFVGQSTIYVATFLRHLEENIFKAFFTSECEPL